MTFKQMLTVGAVAAAGAFGPLIGGVRSQALRPPPDQLRLEA
jgi:hypothetical protein